MAALANFPKSIGIVLYPGFEMLDAAGPIEALNCLTISPSDEDMTFCMISRNMDPVPVGLAGFSATQRWLPTHTFETAPQLDMLLIPGGVGSFDWLPGTESNNVDDYVDFVRQVYHGCGSFRPVKHILSVCNGAILLAKAGILDGRKATTNKTFYSDIAKLGPKTHWMGTARWVVDGNVWTTSGVSAGVDGMLAFMESLVDKKWVTSVVNLMEWRRAESAADDPFAKVEETMDILPTED